MFFSRVSLSKFSLEALFLSWEKGIFILGWEWMKSQVFQNRVGSWLGLAAWLSCESPMRSSRESLFFLHTLEHFFTLSHSLPLQEYHLNIGLLIAEIQANLAWNKANKMVDKIQPYTLPFSGPPNSLKELVRK